MTVRKILFSIRASQEMPAELWQQFVQRTREEGKSVIAVLRSLIENYLKQPRA